MRYRALIVPVTFAIVLVAQEWRLDPRMPDALARQPRPDLSTVTDSSAATILARSAQVYSSCRTYADDSAERMTITGRDSHVRQYTCSTRFDRERGLRHSHVTYEPVSIFLYPLDRGESHVLEGVAGPESGWRGRFDDSKEGSLKDALTRSFLDHGYLFTDILSWLLPTLPLENRWADWVDPRVVRIETIAKRPCWRVRGMRYGADLDLWFDCESYLVRRASLTAVTDTQELLTLQLAIDPRVDVGVSPDELPAWRLP